MLTGLPVPIVVVTAGLSYDDYADNDVWVLSVCTSHACITHFECQAITLMSWKWSDLPLQKCEAGVCLYWLSVVVYIAP